MKVDMLVATLYFLNALMYLYGALFLEECYRKHRFICACFWGLGGLIWMIMGVD